MFLLTLFGEKFVFSGDKGDVLEKTLKLHYGDEAKRIRGYPDGPCHFLDTCGLMYGERSKSGSSQPDENIMLFQIGASQDDPVLKYSASEKSAEIALNDYNGKRGAYLYFSAVCEFIRISLKEKGLYFFHAAAVRYKGKGILIPGPNGSGKSTLMRRLLECGAEYMADDSSIIDLHGSTAMVVGNPEVMNATDLSPGAMKRLRAGGFRKVRGTPFIQPPEGVIRIPVNVAIFPAIVKGPGQICSLTKREVFLKLLESRRTPLSGDEYAGFFDICGELTERVRAAGVMISSGKPVSSGKVVEFIEFE